jgi:hypothetical protein
MVAIDGIPHPHRGFQMNPITNHSASEGCEIKGLLHHVENKGLWGWINHGQTDPIEGHRIPRPDGGQPWFRTNRETNPRRMGLGGQNFPEMTNHTREHGDSSLTMRT